MTTGRRRLADHLLWRAGCAGCFEARRQFQKTTVDDEIEILSMNRDLLIELTGRNLVQGFSLSISVEFALVFLLATIHDEAFDSFGETLHNAFTAGTSLTDDARQHRLADTTPDHRARQRACSAASTWTRPPATCGVSRTGCRQRRAGRRTRTRCLASGSRQRGTI